MNKFQWKTVKRCYKDRKEWFFNETERLFIERLYHQGEKTDLSPRQNSWLNELGGRKR